MRLTIARCVILFIVAMSVNVTRGYGQVAKVKVVSATDQSALIGATIHVTEKNVSTGWVTNIEGEANVDLDKTSKVTVAYLGYLSLEQEITPGSAITIALKEDLLGLEEVVVTGAFCTYHCAKFSLSGEKD